MSTYKIGVLQQALDESVPAAELDAANKQYNELTAKYRDIIQRENSLVARSAIVDNLEVPFLKQSHKTFVFVFLFQGELCIILVKFLLNCICQIERRCTVCQQADKKALEEKEAELKKEMTSLKERNYSLEQMVNELLSKGDGD